MNNIYQELFKRRAKIIKKKKEQEEKRKIKLKNISRLARMSETVDTLVNMDDGDKL